MFHLIFKNSTLSGLSLQNQVHLYINNELKTPRVVLGAAATYQMASFPSGQDEHGMACPHCA